MSALFSTLNGDSFIRISENDTVGMTSEIQNYPFLTGEEFAEACHHLERLYCRATLGPVRRRWKLRTCRALNTALSHGAEYNTYVQIIRPLDGELDDGDLSSVLDRFSFDAVGHLNEVDMDDDNNEMMESEEADTVRALYRGMCFVETNLASHP